MQARKKAETRKRTDNRHSFAPFSERPPMYAQRMEDGFDVSWREQLMALAWEKHNAPTHSPGPPIICHFTHECTAECGAEHARRQLYAFASPHAFKKPDSAQIRAVNAAMQWLGTSVGQNFIREYIRQVDALLEIRDMAEREVAMEQIIKHWVA